MMERTARRRSAWFAAAAVLAVMILAGAGLAAAGACRGTGASTANRTNPTPADRGIAGLSLPRLIVAHQDGVLSLTVDPETGEYRVGGSASLFRPVALALAGGAVFAAHKQAVVRYGPGLDPEQTIAIPSAGAMTAHGDGLLLASGGALVALDADLRERGRVSLGVTTTDVPKDAHDILPHGGVTYLLDNRTHPIYLFRIDTRSAQRLAILQRIDLGGGNVHLDSQAIDPATGDWLVVRTTSDVGFLAGSANLVHSIDQQLLRSTADGVAAGAQPLYAARTECKTDGVCATTATGARIAALTRTPPLQAVIHDSHSYMLADLVLTSEGYALTNHVSLHVTPNETSLSTKAIARRHDSYLFVAVGRSLRVVDMAAGGRLVLAQELDVAVADMLAAP